MSFIINLGFKGKYWQDPHIFQVKNNYLVFRGWDFFGSLHQGIEQKQYPKNVISGKVVIEILRNSVTFKCEWVCSSSVIHVHNFCLCREIWSSELLQLSSLLNMNWRKVVNLLKNLENSVACYRKQISKINLFKWPLRKRFFFILWYFSL